jgi:hypothetical protein
MKSVTVFRTIFLSLLVTVFLLGDASAQEQRRSSGSATVKNGGTTTTQPAPSTTTTPAPVYRPSPDEKQPNGQSAPAPVYRPTPTERAQVPPQNQPSTIDRNYDVDGDGEISKAERKRMKEIRKAEKKRAKELRKAQHEHEKDLRHAEHKGKGHGNGKH